MGRTLSAFVLGVTALAAAVLVDTAPAYAATEQLRLDFDATPTGQVEPGPWTSGCFADVATPGDSGCIAVSAPGSISRATRPSGTGTSPALAFPASGSAVIQVPDAANLNPGTQDFTISALVKITSGQVTSGANLVQKGLFADPAQWKLQLDGGKPGCRIAGLNSQGTAATPVLITADASIADQGWKFVQCKRRGDVLSLIVGADTVRTATGATMNISSTAKVNIGAKGPGLTNNDQFRGELDNAIFSIG
ncbi:LamG-like jellyroll fold domain-containing protein [Micromonospora mirobrigensis]|uniref:Concanavalin A-like lectin/glucanases superfamily protein n=1 Tax=Micromonospora mirobrigensis TaxID=262898 RepID=A0A1C4UJN2_9ACTN|nr:LamG-like jellyroll fold domain-containing protein [Micromonospora mirobrigensis]SCE71946.1 Concanavalin A-like lectin/glucanases superfamily protein [Micromonospora mirobrigensis]